MIFEAIGYLRITMTACNQLTGSPAINPALPATRLEVCMNYKPFKKKIFILKNKPNTSLFMLYTMPILSCILYSTLQVKADDGWLVILGSYPFERKEEALKRQSEFKIRGINARVVTHENYGTLTGGFYIVAVGPQSRVMSINLLEQAKRYVPDSFIKSVSVSSIVPKAQNKGDSSNNIDSRLTRKAGTESNSSEERLVVRSINELYAESSCAGYQAVSVIYNSPYLIVNEASSKMSFNMRYDINFVPQFYNGKFRIAVFGPYGFVEMEGESGTRVAVNTCILNGDAAKNIARKFQYLNNFVRNR